MTRAAWAERKVFNVHEVLDMIRSECTGLGGQYQWATKHHISPAYLSDVLRGKRNIGPAILRALEMKSVTYYKKWDT